MHLDSEQYCNECGCRFTVRVYADGSYDSITPDCNCKSTISPCDNEISIGEAVELMKYLVTPVNH